MKNHDIYIDWELPGPNPYKPLLTRVISAALEQEGVAIPCSVDVLLTTDQGIALFCAALPMAIGGLMSGLYQGKVAASGIYLCAKRPEETGKGIILAAMVETYAVLALLISFIMVNGVKL